MADDVDATNQAGPQYLLNKDGSCFSDLEPVADALRVLANEDRRAYRDANARVIASDTEVRLLVVAGPGAGKSTLFIARIKVWIERYGDRPVYVATFVKKLIRDLEKDIERQLTEDEAQRVTASTLHSLARSLSARNRGTSTCRLGAYVRVVDSFWARVFWEDVLAFHPNLDRCAFPLKALEGQLESEQLDESEDWVELRSTYETLASFFSAAGFSHLITLAQQALEENPGLIEHTLWIIDEYQDFNPAEDHLVRTLIHGAEGVLLAGDDEQALYQQLKGSSPDIIVGHYNDPSFAKAMLPFCSRCSYHICNAASAFMATHRTDEAIEKIYLPLVVDDSQNRVQVVAAAAPGSAVEYIRMFMDARANDYAAYLERREAGTDTDPFLLIISPSGGLTRKKNDSADGELQDLVAQYAARATSARSKDYLLVATYVTAGWYDADNFAVRKLLHEAGMSASDVHALIAEAIESGSTLGVIVERHSDVLATAKQVASLVEDAEGDEDRVAAELATSLAFDNPQALADELRQHPMRQEGLREEEDTVAIESAAAIDAVALMPITGSKGLSAHHVIVLGCDDINMGNTSALAFFVALTRARESLHLITAAKASGAKEPHSYVLDLPEDCCDYLVFKKSGRVVESLANRQAFRGRFASWSRFR
jgi:superfamily I DNA/RNA helicase